MLSQGFDCSHVDHCLYMRKDIDDRPIILVLYMDDMFLVGKRKTSLDSLKDQLKSVVSIKDLGNVEHILGMRNNRKRKDKLLFL